MKKFTFLLLLTLGGAHAQTQIGDVILTPVQPATARPTPVRPVVRPTTPAPVRTPTPAQTAPRAGATATPGTGAATTTSGGYQVRQVPAGWANITGRVVAPSGTRLPQGSKVTVTLEEAGRASAPLLRIQFGTTALPTPYQVTFTASRLQQGRSYGLRAVVTDPSGKVLYQSAGLSPLPSGVSGTANVNVQ